MRCAHVSSLGTIARLAIQAMVGFWERARGALKRDQETWLNLRTASQEELLLEGSARACFSALPRRGSKKDRDGQGFVGIFVPARLRSISVGQSIKRKISAPQERGASGRFIQRCGARGTCGSLFGARLREFCLRIRRRSHGRPGAGSGLWHRGSWVRCRLC